MQRQCYQFINMYEMRYVCFLHVFDAVEEFVTVPQDIVTVPQDSFSDDVTEVYNVSEESVVQYTPRPTGIQAARFNHLLTGYRPHALIKVGVYIGHVL